MKLIIKKSRVPDDMNIDVFEWLWETAGGELAAGGYAASREDAVSDAVIWMKGRFVTVGCDCHWTDDDDVARVTKGPCVGIVAGVDYRGHSTILEISLDAGGYFTYEQSADGDVLSLREVAVPGLYDRVTGKLKSVWNNLTKT